VNDRLFVAIADYWPATHSFSPQAEMIAALVGAEAAI
jgi:hypothetical protein